MKQNKLKRNEVVSYLYKKTKLSKPDGTRYTSKSLKVMVSNLRNGKIDIDGLQPYLKNVYNTIANVMAKLESKNN